ncbi:MAG: thiamine pyrophosphate-dependent enzyme [Promethearchaeota archaeon]
MVKVSEIFENSPGKKVLMSGNEAFARGIYESGVRFAANYPGTPLSEVGDYLKYLSETSEEFTFDYALNEKVALESCIGASWAGVRTVVMFKHVGLNVAADPLHTFPYSGTNGGMIILCGGDPGILSSTNAQDNRLYSLHTKIPIIEPSTVQECKDFIKEGLMISEEYNVPLYIHVTTRLCHSEGIVTYGKIEKPQKVGYFKKNPNRFVNTLWKAQANQEDYFQRIKKINQNKTLFASLIKEKKEGTDSNIGILTSGICYSHVVQACNKLKIQPPILKLGLIYPINKDYIHDFVDNNKLKKLLVVEELEPFIENYIIHIINKYHKNLRELEILGKDFLPRTGELNTEIIIKFFSNNFDIKNKSLLDNIYKKERILKEILPELPIREPTFCPGCPYRPVFYKLRKVTDKITKELGTEFIYGGDIGCYTLAEVYPYEMMDWVICMGAGIGIANGMSHVIDSKKQKLITFIGDSTFFHTGIQPLLNAIKNEIDITIIIFNNDWTAMTGHQEHLATPRNFIKHFGSKSHIDKKGLNLVAFLESLSLDNLIITEAYNLEKLERIFSNILTKNGTNIIVIREECALEKKRRSRRQIQDIRNKKSETYYTISESCVKCNECIEILGCPAINAEYVNIAKDKNNEIVKELRYYIDESRCIPDICPGVCKFTCPNNLIRKTIINPQLDEKKRKK